MTSVTTSRRTIWSPRRLRRRDIPTAAQARSLAERLLADVGMWWPRSRTSATLAHDLADLFGPDDSRVLVAAATLHAIGNSPGLRRTGCPPLDGAVYLLDRGYPPRLAALVAHQSPVEPSARVEGVRHLMDLIPREDSLVADALVYCDVHAGSTGKVVPLDDGLADLIERDPSAGSDERVALIRKSVARVQDALDALGDAGTLRD